MLNKAKRLIRRRVAVLLAVLMALSCLPAPALADEQSAEEPPVQTAAVSESGEQAEPELLTEPDAEADEEGISVDEEHFPDAIFRAYVRRLGGLLRHFGYGRQGIDVVNVLHDGRRACGAGAVE